MIFLWNDHCLRFGPTRHSSRGNFWPILRPIPHRLAVIHLSRRTLNRSRDDAKADVFETPALDDWIFKPYGVRAAGGISLNRCQPNRVQLTHDGRIIEDLMLEERLDGMIDRAIRKLAQGKMMKQVAGLTKDYR
jgi:hypothetical protein